MEINQSYVLNKNKIINDPVYGFITIPSELIYDIIDHPFFQRLRRIRQLGLTDMVYPGALHTRFHHALGAMHLMSITLSNLRSKGHEISDEEFEAAQLAILLHDIGHGPFSHALEFTILNGVKHELLSLVIIDYLNKEFNGALDLTLQIFTDKYPRRFFHDLVASQLDIDRLDYLSRDSFFTGVSEGTIGADRIIKMLDIRDDRIVVEEKGIYSIENFLSARRLMYWQVYLHKTAVSSEKMLIQIIRRVKELSQAGVEVFATPPLQVFLDHDINAKDIQKDPRFIEAYTQLDDYDIWAGIKLWQNHEDSVLSRLCKMIINRQLFRVRLSNESFDRPQIFDRPQLDALRAKIQQQLKLSDEEIDYFYITGEISNAAYMAKGQHINIVTKQGIIRDIAEASDLPNIKAMSKIVRKYYLCWPKSVSL